MHTPRLCIDGRAARDFAARGLVVQELIDQLVAAQGEPDAGSPWVERHRTVLLSHPKQVFSGQLKRYDTVLRTRGSPIHAMWERRFVNHAGISAFHRFRPLDRMRPRHSCDVITTVLPPSRRLPLFLPKSYAQLYVVPSHKDARFLETSYRISAGQIFPILPCARRYVHFSQKPEPNREGALTFVVGEPYTKSLSAKLLSILESRFPKTPRKIVFLRKLSAATAENWLRLGSESKVCFYLTSRPFDWPVLALEALFWGMPVIFSDKNNALSELLPASPLSLSQYLVECPSETELRKAVDKERVRLFEKGVFDPLSHAKQYREVYGRLD